MENEECGRGTLLWKPKNSGKPVIRHLLNLEQSPTESHTCPAHRRKAQWEPEEQGASVPAKHQLPELQLFQIQVRAKVSSDFSRGKHWLKFSFFFIFLFCFVFNKRKQVVRIKPILPQKPCRDPPCKQPSGFSEDLIGPAPGSSFVNKGCVLTLTGCSARNTNQNDMQGLS